MNVTKALLVAATAALATSSAFAADVTIRMTGSTAFRSSTMTGIRNLFAGASDLRIVATNASLTSANQASFKGTIGGKVVLVQCSWSGAMEGVRVVASATPVNVSNFLTEAATNLDTTAGDAGHATIATTGNVESAVADVAMGDSTQFETGYLGAGYNQLVETPVGVIPFVWVKGKSNNPAVQTALDRISNLTALQMQGMLSGFFPLSALSGNAADGLNFAYVCGRDYGSGTRLDTFMESGFGRDNPPVQYTYSTPAGGVIATLSENTDPLLGYSSGSSLRIAVSNATDASIDGAIFSYMGINDATGVTGMTFDNENGIFGGAAASQVLTYNGVAYSHEAVRNGSYPFWNYQVLMHRTGLTGDKLATVESLKTQIINADAAVGGIKLDTMKVTRASMGKVIQPL